MVLKECIPALIAINLHVAFIECALTQDAPPSCKAQVIIKYCGDRRMRPYKIYTVGDLE